MSITIAADMHLLCSLFHISPQKIANDYQGMTVDEIMEAEAAQGNVAAAHYDSEILSNPQKLIELFKLEDVGNKFAILHNMNEHDLDNLLPLLKQEDLVQGLNFFTKEKLLTMDEDLPKQQLVKLVGQLFPPDQIMQLLPEEQLNKMLQSTDMDKQQELKYLQSIKPEILAFMLESATGKPVDGAQAEMLDAQSAQANAAQTAQAGQAGAGAQTAVATPSVGLGGQPNYNKAALLEQIASLPDDKFQEAMLSMPKQAKRAFLLKLTSENPKLLNSVDAQAYTAMMRDRKDKGDIVKASSVIDHENLVKMVAKLPKDLISVVLTQIDTNKFADKLQAHFKDILKQIIAA